MVNGLSQKFESKLSRILWLNKNSQQENKRFPLNHRCTGGIAHIFDITTHLIKGNPLQIFISFLYETIVCKRLIILFTIPLRFFPLPLKKRLLFQYVSKMHNHNTISNLKLLVLEDCISPYWLVSESRHINCPMGKNTNCTLAYTSTSQCI